MKITKKQLTRIIKEETKRHNKLRQRKFSKQVREAFARNLVLYQSDMLLREGWITRGEHLRIRRCRTLVETNQHLSDVLVEDIGDTVAKFAAKMGKEGGKAAGGIAKGLWSAIKPVAKQVGKAGLEAAGGVLKTVADQAPKALAGAADAVGGFKKLLKKAKEGSDFEKMAEEAPEEFLASYEELKKKLEGLGAPVGTADEAGAALGVFETEDGQEALEAGAKEAGMSPEQLKALMGIYVTQSKFVDVATKAQEAK